MKINSSGLEIVLILPNIFLGLFLLFDNIRYNNFPNSKLTRMFEQAFVSLYLVECSMELTSFIYPEIRSRLSFDIICAISLLVLPRLIENVRQLRTQRIIRLKVPFFL